MNSDDLFGPNPRVIDLKAEDRWDAIDELIGHLVLTGGIEAAHRDAIAEAIKKPERELSTGIGNGVAVPHAQCEFVHEVVVVVGRSRNGIQFDSIDGKLVHAICLFLVPRGRFQEHENALANIAKLLLRIAPENLG